MHRRQILRHSIAVIRLGAWCPFGRVRSGLVSGGRAARVASGRMVPPERDNFGTELLGRPEGSAPAEGLLFRVRELAWFV